MRTPSETSQAKLLMMALLAPGPAGTAQILLGGRINLSELEVSIHVWPKARGMHEIWWKS